MLTIPIEISARHCHIAQDDLEKLFGNGYKLTPIKPLSQEGQYAAQEVIEIQTVHSWGLPPHMDFTFGKNCDHNQLRILGPVRDYTQVELSWSDCILLGLQPKVVVSGNYEETFGGVVLVGPNGEIKLEKGIIVPQRHIHCNTNKAAELGLTHGQIVSVRVIGEGTQSPIRQITFYNVIIRTHPTFDWQMHLDIDEGNAAGISGMGLGEVIL